MSLDLGELVGSLRMDVLPWDNALSKADADLVSFAAGTSASARKAGDNATAGLASGLAGMSGEARSAGSAAAADLGSALDGAEAEAKSAGSDAGKGFGDAFKATAKDAGTAGGAVLGTGIAVGIADNMSVEAGLNKVGVQLGLGQEQMKVAGQVAGDIYANNFGEDLPQINEAMAGVIRNMNIGVKDVNLQPITEQVLTVADAFDQDLGMTTAAVGQMIRTGMVKDAQEGLDVLTAGLQTPANKADDLAETMNEYGTQFRKLGLDGKDSMGLLSQGLQGGARDADIVADSLKEFSLKTQESTTRVTKLKDGTEALSLTGLGQAFHDVGIEVLDANGKLSDVGVTFQKDLAGGGPKAKKALDTVLDGIKNIKDPTQRTADMVALFGTQAEDMGDALLNLDLDSAGREIGKVDGAAQKAVDTMGSGAQATIDSYGRKLIGMGRDAIEALGPVGSVAGAVVGILPAVASVVGPVVGSWLAMSGASLSGAAAMAASWLIAIAPIAIIIAAVVGLAVIIYKNWDTIKEYTGKAWGWVVDKIQGVPDAISNVAGTLKEKGKDLIQGAKDGIENKWEDAKTWLSNVPDKATNAVGGVATTLKEKGKDLIAGAKAGVEEKWEDLKTWFTGLGEKITNNVTGMGTLLKSAGVAIVQGLIDGIVEKFQALKDKVGELTSWIKNHKGPKAVDLLLWRGPGNWIMQGLMNGLDDQMPALERKVGDVTDTIANTPMPDLMASAVPSIPESAEVRAYATGQAGTSVVNHWNISETTDPQATAAEVARRQALAGAGS